MNAIVGIDLGTTYSVIAYVDDSGKAQVIKNRDGFDTTPSVILFEDATTLVGINAKDQAVLQPDRVVQFIKRQMGNANYQFFAPDGNSYGPEALSALILKRLKEDAEAALGCSVKYAVITVPAYFDDAQRKATQDAGAIAGLEVLRVINEPTAAALAYGIDGTSGVQNVLVYDLGGGTFDVTVMRVGKSSLDVIATSGDKNLGGFDWDNELINHLRQEIIGQGGTDPFDDDGFVQELREKAEKAKIQLSAREKATIPLTVGKKRYGIEVSRVQFEDLTKGLLARTSALVEGTLDDANLTWSEIDKVLLVGGSSRMPAVSAELLQLSGKSPSRELDPDLIVAMGAALQASMLPIPSGSDGPSYAITPPNRLVQINDVCAHSLGVVVREDGALVNSIILKKNSPIPCSSSQDYFTVSDNQTEIDVRITQGEDTELSYVKEIGNSTLKIPPHPKESPIRVQLGYDSDGVISVRVFDLASDPPKDLGNFHIDREANLVDDAMEDLKKRIAAAILD